VKGLLLDLKPCELINTRFPNFPQNAASTESTGLAMLLRSG
jgi:hypothetical protein